MDGSFENEVPPPAVDGTDSAIPSSGLDVLFNKKGEDDPGRASHGGRAD